MAHIFAIANMKGGTGKTNVSFNLAGSLSEKKHKVLLIDMDGQASLTSILFDDYRRLKPNVFDLIDDEQDIQPTTIIRSTGLNGIDILPSGKKLQKLDSLYGADLEAQEYLDMALEPLHDTYAFIIIDCPPNLGTATQMSMIAATGVIIPTECSDLSINELGRTIEFMQAIKKRVNPALSLVGIVINKFNTRRKLEQEYLNLINQTYQDLVFQANIKNNKEYMEVSTAGQPVTQLRPRSDQAQTYRNLTQELINRLN